ncbi:amino acid ABC transporter permease [Paenibacillus sp. PK4536]|uniref:Amino acid ABC transporter permease n=2 Tax=Paenibacillus TaxID=44249 RepID=A0AAX3M6E4_9BACL|nr:MULTISPECIES: amino acid ABC transporter permease [Paenibacillus]MDN4617079.1 amino acid ABC transporter permease [Paenibacillus sp. PsM32]MDQ1233074.1 putative glutamine transport system permease protein [Paenibacillus sp. SORGH_AS_0306]MDR6110119.1 putative glutamine transport system permease protein [Paenibacillus sp. SORGH_AS_0338]ODP28774.1 putative glutamine ABC transporter permease protein GlnP [Paenibacillus nuruki]TKJ92036.1 amino acid ABC transporter permease [Paenibacillus sp. CF
MDFIGAYSPDNLRFLMEGLKITLFVAFIAIILSFVIGCIVGTIRYAKVPILSPILMVIVEVLRNLPLLLIILFVQFGLPEIGIKMTITFGAIVALTAFEASMISEIVRAGLTSVPKGQVEAARSSGLTQMQTLWHIVLPQGLRKMVPPLVSQFISLLKDTSLAVIISLAELVHNAQIIMGQNSNYPIPILLLIAVIYFVINYALSLISKRLETKTA